MIVFIDQVVSKRGECRFKIPKSQWESILGDKKKVTAFDVVTRCSMGDQFLNTFSLAVSGTFGYNTNLQIGDIAHVYYNTLYGSKSNQDTNTRGFVRLCNTLSRRM